MEWEDDVELWILLSRHNRVEESYKHVEPHDVSKKLGFAKTTTSLLALRAIDRVLRCLRLVFCASAQLTESRITFS